jgi:hypothetical protein
VPVVGEAHIVVRALTNKVSEDIRKGFDGVRGDIAARTGADLGDKFAAGFNKNANQNIFSRISDAIKSMAPASEGARLQLNSLIKAGYKANVAFSLIVGTIGALVGGLGALIGAAGGAAASLGTLVGYFVSLKVGMSLAGMAMKGVGQAVSAVTSQTGAQTKSIAELREELQQLRFDAEQAAISEEQAALRLEQARDNLARTADLPVNSTARREAEIAYKQADLDYRRAKDRTDDLNAEVKKGLKPQGGGGNDPFAGLTDSQKDFARYLITLQPKLKQLREAVAKGFLPMLETQLRRIMGSGAFKIIEDGFTKIGVALGDASEKFTDNFLEPKTLENIATIFDIMADSVSDFGEVIGNVFSSFTTIIARSAGPIGDFSDWLVGTTEKFNKWLNSFTDTQLEEFFGRASDIAAQFGRIAGNVIDGLISIIDANFEADSGGGKLLTFLEESTQGFKDLGGEGGRMAEYFSKAADNLIIILDGIGGMFTGILELGANPAIGKFFDRIKDAGPSIGNIADKGVEALPALADLIVALAEMVDKLTDSKAIEIFFTVIKDAVVGVNDLLENDWIVNMLTFLGQVKAVTLAFGVLKSAAELVTFGVLGNIGAGAGGIGKTVDVVKDLGVGMKDVGGIFKESFGQMGKQGGGFFKTFQNGMGALTFSSSGFAKGFGGIGGSIMRVAGAFGPWGIAIGAIIAAFAILYATNEDFRKSFEPVWKAFGDLFKAAGEALKPLQDALTELYEVHIKPLLFGEDGKSGLVSGLSWFVSNVLPLVINGIQAGLVPAIGFIVSILTTVIHFLGSIIDGFRLFVDAIVKLFSGDLVGALKSGVGGLVLIIIGIMDGVANVVISVINFVIDRINAMIDMAADGPFADVIEGLTGVKLADVKIQRVATSNMADTARKAFGLAKGGIVSPTPGGTFAVVAEAGRSERVEPLDPDGMSKRDKAMIDYLSGGSGGGMNITVNAGPGMDERELAAMVSRRLAFELRKGATA